MTQLNFNEFVLKTEQWAEDRNLIAEGEPSTQLMKTYSELGELSDAIIKGDVEGQKDGIGDVMVTLVIYVKKHNDSMSNIKIDDILKDDRFLDGLDENPKKCFFDFIYVVQSMVNYKPYYHKTSVIYAVLKLCASLGIDISDSCNLAYDSIKDRKGVMYNGVFVKESDENYQRIVEELKTKNAS